MIVLSGQQDHALRKILQWFRDPNRPRGSWFYLAGFAGTGKSTIAHYIVEQLGLDGVTSVEDPFSEDADSAFRDVHHVQVACFTGKAAHVIKRKGFPQARTIHSLIYKAVHKGKGRVEELESQIAALKDEGAPYEIIHRVERELDDELHGLKTPSWSLNPFSDLRYAKLLLVDECSMVDQQIGEDLLSYGIPILALGDPGQLEPIKGQGFFTSRQPDFILTEVHRQAQDSAVLRLATAVREEGVLPRGTFEDPSGFSSIVTNKSDPARMLAADQIIVGMNATRLRSNNWMRQQKGFRSPIPKAGERLICLRNHHESELLNGAQYIALTDGQEVDDRYYSIRVRAEELEGEGRAFLCHRQTFMGDVSKMRPWDWDDARAFDSGYAITGHKSQGSQWDHVAISDEWRREDWRKHMYTCLTRAAQSVYVVSRD